MFSVPNDITAPVISSNPFNITLVMSFNKNILVINDISKLNVIIIPKIIAQYLFNTDEEKNLSEIISNLQKYYEDVRNNSRNKP